MSGQRSLLEAWTSAIEMDVLASGALVNKRMDLLVGSFSRGALGLPYETLTERFHAMQQQHSPRLSLCSS